MFTCFYLCNFWRENSNNFWFRFLVWLNCLFSYVNHIWVSIQLLWVLLYHACLSSAFSDVPFVGTSYCSSCNHMAFRQCVPCCVFASLGHPEILCHKGHKDGESYRIRSMPALSALKKPLKKTEK